MRSREEGHAHVDKLGEDWRDKSQLEGDQSHQSKIWQTMIQVKDSVVDLGKLQDYSCDMLLQFVADSVDLNQQLIHSEHKVAMLEKKLGTIHSVDFKAQHDSQTLKKEMLELQQTRIE